MWMATDSMRATKDEKRKEGFVAMILKLWPAILWFMYFILFIHVHFSTINFTFDDIVQQVNRMNFGTIHNLQAARLLYRRKWEVLF